MSKEPEDLRLLVDEILQLFGIAEQEEVTN